MFDVSPDILKTAALYCLFRIGITIKHGQCYTDLWTMPRGRDGQYDSLFHCESLSFFLGRNFQAV